MGMLQNGGTEGKEQHDWQKKSVTHKLKDDCAMAISFSLASPIWGFARKVVRTPGNTESRYTRLRKAIRQRRYGRPSQG